MATGTLATKTERKKVSELQYRAWGYYGLPTTSSMVHVNAAIAPVGEVRYIIGWEGDQMSRMDWTVTVNGSQSWSLTLPNGTTVTSNPNVLVDDPTHPRRASNRLLKEAINWTRSTVRQVTTNLFVAGQFDYAAFRRAKDYTWQVISVIHPDRDDLLASAQLSTQGLWPHPADPQRPDAPLFGVLDTLEELVWLSRLARAQSRNRVAMRGILGIADGLSFQGGNPDSFWADWNTAMSKPMEDPDNVQPLILRGSTDLVAPNRDGMNGLSWVVPSLPYDDKVDVRMNAAIQRLSYGLPVPPEVLLGMQSQSRATAYQVDENSYRGHVEPAADLVAQVATDALSLVVDDEVRVTPDPTAILARHRTVADTLEAFDRGAVSYDYLREVLAIPADAAPTREDLEQIAAAQGGGALPTSGQETPASPSTQDPGNDAANPAVEDTMAAEIRGASRQAVERARERIGAKLRTRQEWRSKIPTEVPNDQVCAHLGFTALDLSQADIRIAPIVEPAVASLTRCYSHDDDREARLQEQVTAHILATLDSPEAQPLPDDICREAASES